MTGDQKKLHKDADDSPKSVFSISKTGTDLVPLEKQVAELQERIVEVSDKADEDKFLAGIAAVIVVDVLAFPSMSAIAITVISVFECIFLSVLASRYGVEEPKVWLAALMRKITRAKEN